MKDQTARTVMTKALVTIDKETLLVRAIDLLLKNSVSGLPVVDEQKKLIGIITEHDIVNFAFSGNADTTRVKEAMTTDVLAFSPDKKLSEIINCFASRRIRRVPIVDDDRRLIGIVSRRDILREMLKMYTGY